MLRRTNSRPTFVDHALQLLSESADIAIIKEVARQVGVLDEDRKQKVMSLVAPQDSVSKQFNYVVSETDVDERAILLLIVDFES